MAFRRQSAATNKRRRLVLQPYSIFNAPAVIDPIRYWSKIANLPQLRGPRQNIAITFGMENKHTDRHIDTA